MSETVYSISRLDCINSCLTEAYYTYRLNDRGKNNIYGLLGHRIHSVLEAIVNGDATEDDLLPAMKQEFEDLENLGIAFPKDPRGGDSVRQGWTSNMEHFCSNYKSPRGKKLQTELEVYYTSPKGNKLVGYIDLLRTLNDGSVEIYDYKTSSLYSKSELLEHGRQLCVYALALEQDGLNVRSVNWIFTKYVDVKYMGFKTKKSKEKIELTKTLERRKIVAELRDSIAVELAEKGVDELDIEFILEEAINNNAIPEQVAELYKIKPTVVEYVLTDEIKKECIDYIDRTIELWESLSDEECQDKHRAFTKLQKNGKEVPDMFYCFYLCAHNDKCPHFYDYKQTLTTTEELNDEDLF